MKLPSERCIVMVDDNEGDARLARVCCEQSSLQNPWMSFTNGPEFLAFLGSVRQGEAKQPGLVLLDLHMPGMTGYEVLAEIRHDPFFDDLPIYCMLGTSTDPRARDKALRLGASGFASKTDQVDEYIAFFNSLA